MGTSLDDDIRAIVEQVIDSGSLLHIPEASKRLAAAHPDSGLGTSEIAEILLRAGVSARVPLEWGSSRDYRNQIR